MWWRRTQVQPEAEILALRASALENNAVRAGVALACSYADSHEYEAELIAERRAAGVYVTKRGKRATRYAALALGLLLVVVFAVLVN